VHLLVSEPEHELSSTAIRARKQSMEHRLATKRGHFWQARYYD
jgi:hypothetical protein